MGHRVALMGTGGLEGSTWGFRPGGPDTAVVGPVVFLTTPITFGERSVLSAGVYQDGSGVQDWHGGAVSPGEPSA